MGLPIKEVKCPVCHNIGRFRTNDKGQIISSCSSCGWKPGSGHKITNRYVVKEVEKEDGTKVRKMVPP